ncbi:MAG: hypothetical protein AAGE88_18280 [Actinomycetota bacterium]
MKRSTKLDLINLVRWSRLPVRQTVINRTDCIQTNAAEALIRRGYAVTLHRREGRRWIIPTRAGVDEATRLRAIERDRDTRKARNP